MSAKRSVVVALSVVVVLVATGCQTLRDLGFESRSSRLARQYHAQKEELAAQNAELETRLVATTNEYDKTKRALDEARVKLTEKEKVVAAPVENPSEQKWAKWTDELRGVATPFVTATGERGFRFKGDILFGSGKAAVKTDAKRSLGTIAEVIRTMGGDVVVYVDGHTDSDPLVRTKHLYHDNYGLGAARATSVAKELTALGISKTQLVTRSFGKDVPLADNSKSAGKKQNRRVEISFALNPAMQASVK